MGFGFVLTLAVPALAADQTVINALKEAYKMYPNKTILETLRLETTNLFNRNVHQKQTGVKGDTNQFQNLFRVIDDIDRRLDDAEKRVSAAESVAENCKVAAATKNVFVKE